MIEIGITIPGEPVAKGRPKARVMGGKFAQFYTPARTVKYESLVRSYAKRVMEELGNSPLACPLYVKVYIYKEIPKSWTKAKREAATNGKLVPTCVPDADNYAKAILDAMNGVVYLDDCQITDLYVKKRYGIFPQAHIVIRGLDSQGATPVQIQQVLQIEKQEDDNAE